MYRILPVFSCRFCYKAAQCAAGNVLSSHLIADETNNARRAYTLTMPSDDNDESRSIQSMYSFDSDESSIHSDNSSNFSQSSQHKGVSKPAPVGNAVQGLTSASHTSNPLLAQPLSATSTASDISADYVSSVAVKSTSRRLQKITSKHPTMQADPHIAEIMQWKHLSKAIQDSLPPGSPCKQALPFDAASIAFQSKLFRSLPGINSVLNGPAFAETDLVSAASQPLSSSFGGMSFAQTSSSSRQSSPHTRRRGGRSDANSTLPAKKFCMSKSLNDMSPAEIDTHTFDAIKTSLETSGYIVEQPGDVSLHSLLNGSQLADDEMHESRLLLGSQGLLTHLGVKPKKFSASLSPYVNPGAKVSTRELEGSNDVRDSQESGDNWDAFGYADPVSTHFRASSALYPGKAVRLTVPRIEEDVETKELPRDRKDSSVSNQVIYKIPQKMDLIADVNVDEPLAATRLMRLSDSSSAERMSCDPELQLPVAKLKSFTGFRGTRATQKIAETQLSAVVALSTTQKSKLKADRNEALAAAMKLPYLVRSQLPDQCDKVVPPKELLFNPARLP
jgi:hypothetical protein